MNATAELGSSIASAKLHGGLILKKILVPLDFSAPSIATVHYAVAFARRFNACLHLAHVHREGEDPRSSGAADLLLEYGEMASFLQSSACNPSSESPVPVWPENCHLRCGEPDAEICRLAEEIDADLIVIAAHGQSSLRHLVLGSTTERVVTHAHCPVLVPRFEPADPSFEIRNLLVPVDFSEASLTGMRYAALLARSCGARLSLLHVLPPVRARSENEAIEIESAQLISGHRNLKMLLKSPVLEHLPCDTSLIAGDPVKEIIAAAEKGGSELIVASTHGRTTSRRALLGTTAEQIVRKAKTSVLIVPSHGFVPKYA